MRKKKGVRNVQKKAGATGRGKDRGYCRYRVPLRSVVQPKKTKGKLKKRTREDLVKANDEGCWNWKEGHSGNMTFSDSRHGGGNRDAGEAGAGGHKARRNRWWGPSLGRSAKGREEYILPQSKKPQFTAGEQSLKRSNRTFKRSRHLTRKNYLALASRRTARDEGRRHLGAMGGNCDRGGSR